MLNTEKNSFFLVATPALLALNVRKQKDDVCIRPK